MKLLKNDLANPEAIHYSNSTAAKKTDEKAILESQIERLNKKILRLREAYLSGIEDAETYATTKLSIEQEITAAKQQLRIFRNPCPLMMKTNKSVLLSLMLFR